MPLCGVAFALLVVLGVLVTPGGDPGFVGRPEAIARYYDAHANGVLAAQAIYLVAGIFLLWFIATLRPALSDAGQGVPTAVSAGAVSGTALMIASASLGATAALRVQQRGSIDPQVAAAMHDISQALYGLAAPMAWAAAVLALAVAALHAGALPRWLGYVSVPMGIALAIPPIDHVSIIVFTFWVPVTAAALHGRSRYRLNRQPAGAQA